MPANERAQHLTVTATSSDPALIANPTITYTDGAITGTLRFTPAPNASGSAIISVRVADDRAQLVDGGDLATHGYIMLDCSSFLRRH